MSLGEIIFIGWSILMVIISVVYVVWAKESGQFKHIEQAKYDMLEEHEPLPWPNRDGEHARHHQGNPVKGNNGGDQ